VAAQSDSIGAGSGASTATAGVSSADDAALAEGEHGDPGGTFTDDAIRG
jgi:hypothetical protein